MNIFFDLDGTLLDSKKRLYTLFQNLVPNSGLSMEEYWELKRNNIDHRNILSKKFNYSEKDYNQFEKIFLEKIEQLDYLKLDTIFIGVYELLDALIQENNVFLVTSRKNKVNALIQLKLFDICKYFKDVLITGYYYDKAELIGMIKYQKEDFIIGDSGYDILTGQQLGIHTIAVSYGFLNKQILENYKPEFIVDNLVEITGILEKTVL